MRFGHGLPLPGGVRRNRYRASVLFHNGTSLFEINLSGSNRYHVVSKKTRNLKTLDAESTAELLATIERIETRLRDQGYTEVNHVVEFFAESSTTPLRAQTPLNVN